MLQKVKPAAIRAWRASAFVNWQVGGSEDRPSQVLQQAIRAELAGSDSCSALGITISSSSPVLALCRKLVQAGFDPSTPLEVRRGETLSLRVRSIGEGARLEVNAKGNGFIARRAVRAGPSARKKTSGPAHDGDSPGFSASLCSSTAPTSWRGSYERGRGAQAKSVEISWTASEAIASWRRILAQTIGDKRQNLERASIELLRLAGAEPAGNRRRTRRDGYCCRH